VADDNPIHREVILPSAIARANALLQAGRPRDALEILTPLRRKVALCDADIRGTYSKNMSGALVNLGRVSEALAFAAEAVDLASEFYGPQSQTTLVAMSLQGQLFLRVGRVHEAKETLGRVLATSTRVFGPDHELTRNTRDALRFRAARTG